MADTNDVLGGLWTYFNLVFNNMLLLILVATFLISKRASRHVSLITLCITWIFSGVFSNLLYYGNWRAHPPTAICITQASFMSGTTPMWSTSVCMFFWYMSISCSGKYGAIGTAKTMVMLITPYIAQLSFTLATLIISLQRPELVSLEKSRHLFCTLDNRPISLAIALFALLMSLFIIKFKIDLAIIAYRSRYSLRRMQKINGTDAQFYIRVMIFGVFVSLGVIGNVISIPYPNNILSDIFRAIAGTIVFLAFGTQSEVLRVWFGWVQQPTFLRKHPSDHSEPITVIRSQESTLKERQSDVESLVDMYFTPPSEARTSLRSGGDLSSARAVAGHITSTD